MIAPAEIELTSPRNEREAQARRLVDGPDEAAAARGLGQCPGLAAEKLELAERILARDPASAALLPLVRHLDEERLTQLAADSLGKPERVDLLLEIARHAPGAVRPHVKSISDERTLWALRAEAPDEWLAPLREAYETSHDPKDLRAIGQLRTEAALECLIDASKKAPDGHLAEFALAIENAGVSPVHRTPSVYFDAFRAYVVSRDESPHHLGNGYAHAVPLCPFCQTPAERLVTFDAASLPDYELEVNPTYFWYRCNCDNGDHILVKHAADGLEGVMTAMTQGPVSSPLPAGALLLERFPRTSVVGGPARPGAGEHQVGGFPVWIHETRFPRVPGAHRSMRFLGSIDLAATPLGRATGQSGIVYCFLDDESGIAVSLRQLP